MKKQILNTAIFWTILGLVAGVFFRTYVQQINNFTGHTQLSVLHTHLLALGTLFFLIILSLEKSFELSKKAKKMFSLFFWHYNGGLFLSSLAMLVIGILQVGGSDIGSSLVILAGFGHILITVAFVFLFIALKKVVK